MKRNIVFGDVSDEDKKEFLSKLENNNYEPVRISITIKFTDFIDVSNFKEDTVYSDPKEFVERRRLKAEHIKNCLKIKEKQLNSIAEILKSYGVYPNSIVAIKDEDPLSFLMREILNDLENCINKTDEKE